jgi:hypothetical protein
VIRLELIIYLFFEKLEYLDANKLVFLFFRVISHASESVNNMSYVLQHTIL